ncbi:MAG: magnesium/cobalt transporter CorA [Saprospiraceae bacterium]|nr:magnesium/cobalt transporter CorA [Saprospiraceae bacterium]
MKTKNRNIQHSKIKHPPSKKGLAPGTHVYTGTNIMDISVLETISYDSESVEVKKPTLEEFKKTELSDKNLWINVDGISNEVYVRDICNKYGIHYLYQEDIMNVFQRPKVEDEANYLFFTFKSLEWDDVTKEIEEEQFSIILTKNTVITFQEKPGDYFDLLRDKLNTKSSILREKSIDYLFYRLLDITVDNYFEILEKLGEHLELLEIEIMSCPKAEHLTLIQNNKKDTMQMRKNIYPLRDVLNKLVNIEHPLIKDQTKKYFKDVLDHTVQVLETVETYREINVSLKDVYLNSLSHEMNKIIKVLTIISTFFIPLTFIVGVYGMNFKYMPELEWRYGYYLIWGIMIVIVIGLTIWFKRKNWF